MTDKLRTIGELIADARTAATHPRRARRHLTCASCGQMYDKADAIQTTQHLSAAHSKWTPLP